MRRFVALVAVASLLSGCAHVRRINPSSATELDDLNRRLHSREASIELVTEVTYREGAKLRAERVRVRADSTSLLFGVLGLVAGTVFGGIMGSTDVYDLVEQPRATQRPSGRR